MKACMFCGERTEGGKRFVLCGACRAQAGALGAGAAEYVWYVRAVKRALFEAETGEESSDCRSLPSRHQSFTKRNIRTEIFY